MNEYPLAPVQPATKVEVTRSVIEIPDSRDQSIDHSPPPEDNDIDHRESVFAVTPVYQ